MRSFATSQVNRNSLAFGLCLLAILFALEAKFAWYAPANHSFGGIQSEKARPADLPALVSHRVPAHSPASLPLAMFLFVAVAAIARRGSDFLSRLVFDLSHIPVRVAPYFSPGLFFRPPPELQLL